MNEDITMQRLLLSMLIIGSLVCCTSKTNNNLSTKQSEIDDNKVGNDSTAATTTCYTYTQNKDTITLSISTSGNTFTGDMLYQLKEKDRNKGTLQGTIIGDTLLADYHFASEGMMSVRQVAFIKQGNTLKEGFGDLKLDKDNQYIFKNPHALQFTGFVLTPTACN
jgi:hypothetical protein